MYRTEELFLELLRAGLWGHKADSSLFSEGVDWNAIMKMAREQTVLLLVADGYLTLPSELQPAREVQFRIESYRTRMSKAHLLLNKTISEVCNLMHDNGVRTVLFKGQGLAGNYITPLSRACGDIDLYVGEVNLEKAKSLIDTYGEPQGEDSESSKHYHCKRNGIDIELHRIAESLDTPVKNSRYQKWTRAHLIESDLFEKMTFEGTEVNLPPAQFNVLYVFNHFYHHFQTSGVGLRQLCDWVRLLHTHAGQYDRLVLEKELRSFGLYSVWKVFAQIAVDYLGMNPEEMPLYKGPAGKKARKTLDMIFAYGNFGRTELATRKPRPKGYYSGKLYSFRHTLKNNFLLFPIFPLKTIIHFIVFTIHGTMVAIMRK